MDREGTVDESGVASPSSCNVASAKPFFAPSSLLYSASCSREIRSKLATFSIY